MRLNIENGRIRWDEQWTPAYIDLSDEDIKRIVQESPLFSTDPDLLLAEIDIIHHRVARLWIMAGNLVSDASGIGQDVEALKNRLEAERKSSNES